MHISTTQPIIILSEQTQRGSRVTPNKQQQQQMEDD